MSYLTEAFKQMELLESEQFTFDKDGAAKLANFLDDDMLNDFEAIIDPEAETKEELKDSYMGNVICRCPICRSLIYRDPEEIKVDEEEQLANLEEPCPYCFEHGGFEIVGQVAPYEEVTVEAEEGTKVEVDGQEVNTDPETEEDNDSDDDEDEVLDESLNEGTIYDKLVKAFPELADETSSDVRARRHTRDNEDLEDSQRFPVEGTNQRNLVERRCAKRRHTRDNEDLEDSQRYPIESPVGTKGLKENINEEESETAKRDPKARLMSKRRHARDNEDLEDSQRYPIESPAPAQTGLRESTNENFDNSVGTKAWTDEEINFYEEAAKKLGIANLTMKEKQGKVSITAEKDGKELTGNLSWQESHVKDINDAVEALQFAMPDLYESLREGMEDISITTDDQVIKVKATPRADKETIQPVEEETKDVIEAPEMEEETPVEEVPVEEDMPIEDQDVEIEEFDEESFDNLGESYLKQVYENVAGFKTSDVQSTPNKIIIEGIISFNSGKKAKTKFMFEAKDATKSGKLRFTGLNENISKNKKAFTLTGILKENKLISESLNYNYSAQAEDGKAKRLYGTIRR